MLILPSLHPVITITTLIIYSFSPLLSFPFLVTLICWRKVKKRIKGEKNKK